MFGFFKILVKIGGIVLLVAAGAALACRCFSPKGRYLMTEQFDEF